MNFRIERKGWTFYIGLNRTELVEGYNSDLGSDYHFLMWDFDDVDLSDVIRNLSGLQENWSLPKIYILRTSDRSYHANCFSKVAWTLCRTIVASSHLVDKKFLSIGILRGFFTLRFTPAHGKGEPEIVAVLNSAVSEDLTPFEVSSFVTYPKKRR